MTTRTDLARRLELAQVEEVGEFVTGRARGMTVTLEGEAPFRACVVELGSAIPIARGSFFPTSRFASRWSSS